MNRIAITIATTLTADNPDYNDGDDELIVTEDERHGIKGYRVARYIWSLANGMDWDERYKFYTSLDEVIQAFKTKSYKTGEEAF